MDFGAAGFMTVSPFTLEAKARRVCPEALRQRVRRRVRRHAGDCYYYMRPLAEPKGCKNRAASIRSWAKQ